MTRTTPAAWAAPITPITPTARWPLAVAVAVCLLLWLCRAAAAEPSDQRLLWVGAGLALPTYALGVTLHEGSHALAAKALGAEVLSINLLPGRDPRTGAFHFGLTRVRGLRCDSQRIFFLIAPKLTDLTLLAGFTGLVLSDAWPRARYGQLALSVLATGLWVDFAKDVLSFSPFNDVVKVMNLTGLQSEWRRLPVRLGYATIAVTLGFVVARGYQRTFDREGAAASDVAFALPLVQGRF